MAESDAKDEQEETPKFTKDEYDVLATAPAEHFYPREVGAWKDAPEGVVEGADEVEGSSSPKSQSGGSGTETGGADRSPDAPVASDEGTATD